MKLLANEEDMTERAAAKPSVLVLGAGELGMNILAALQQRHFDVSVLLRPVQSGTAEGSSGGARYAASLGVGVVHTDIALESVEALALVFQTFDIVVNCMGFVAGPGTQLKVASAAVQAGVPRYVPWQFGINYDQVELGSSGGIFDEQIHVRTFLRSQTRISWLVVSTGMFTSFLFEPSFGVVDLTSREVNALGGWDTKVTVTTPKDIGHLTSELLGRVPEGGGHVVYVAGDTISYEKLADVADGYFGYKFSRKLLTLAHLRQELSLDPDDVMKKYRLAFAQESGVAWRKEATFNARNNLKTESVAEWLERSGLVQP